MSKILILPISKSDIAKFVYFIREIYFKDKNMSSSSVNIMLENVDYVQFKREMKDKFDKFFLINKLEFIRFIDELKEKGIITDEDLQSIIGKND
jgi:hypothetical protein